MLKDLQAEQSAAWSTPAAVLGNQAPEGFAWAFNPERKFSHYAGMAAAKVAGRIRKLIEEKTLSISI